MARNCPGGQQVFTGVLKATLGPERAASARTTDIAIGHMVTAVSRGESRIEILAEDGTRLVGSKTAPD